MPNTIDELNMRDPLELSAQDIDGIIAYQRKMRAAFLSGIKPKKHEGPKISLAQLGLQPATPSFKRRKLGT